MNFRGFPFTAVVLLILSISVCCDSAFARGPLFATGYNWFGECNVPPADNYIAVSAGWQHSMALKDDSAVIAWGYNQDFGQCNTPPRVKFKAIEGGEFFSLGIKTDGSLIAWGRNQWGQCMFRPAMVTRQ